MTGISKFIISITIYYENITDLDIFHVSGAGANYSSGEFLYKFSFSFCFIVLKFVKVNHLYCLQAFPLCGLCLSSVNLCPLTSSPTFIQEQTSFCLLIQIGSFFMINLCLVVIATQFSETKQREHQLMQEQRAQCLSSSTLASMAEPGDCYEEIFQLVCHVLRKAKRRSAALYYTLRGKPPPAGGGRGNRRGGNANGERHHLKPPRCE